MTLLTDVTECVAFARNDVTVTLRMNGYSLTAAASNAGTPALTVSGGTLQFADKPTITGGLWITGGGRLAAALTEGVFARGNNTYSISVASSDLYKTVFDLRKEGHAFAGKDTSEILEIDANTAPFGSAYTAVLVDAKIVVCDHSVGFKEGACLGCTYHCQHGKIANNACTVCGTPIWAKDDDGRYYADLADALEDVADGGTVTMLATPPVDYDQIGFCYDENGNHVDKTVTLIMGGHSLSCEGAAPLLIESGKLIISDAATISQLSKEAAQPAVYVDNNEQGKDRGTLEFKGKATLTGGIFFSNYGRLEGGLKGGTIITGNGTYSVSVEQSIDTYSRVAELLAKDCAFAKYENGTAGEIVNGYVTVLTEDVIVVSHPKHDGAPDASGKYVCACGYTCSTHTFSDGKCTTCGYECPHTTVNGSTCSDCKARMAAKVTSSKGTGYYAKNINGSGDDQTLRAAFDNAPDGSTITLLENGKLTQEGTGRNITIGTLEIAGSSAEISFRCGAFGKIVGDGAASMQLGTLLARGDNNAFRKVDGTFVPYNTEITSSNAVWNVTIAGCPHDSLGAENTCHYCGLQHIVAIQTNDLGTIETVHTSKTWTKADIHAAANDAFDVWNQYGGTLHLFVDFEIAEKDYTRSDAGAINLNGHKVTGGTLTLRGSGGTVTITDANTDRRGAFANVAVNAGASLIVDGVAVGKLTTGDKTAHITLKEGSAFTGYDKCSGVMIADWIEEGCCVAGDIRISDAMSRTEEGSFAVTRVPATFTATTKSGTIPYGGMMPETILPAVTLEDTNVTVIELLWQYRKGVVIDAVSSDGRMYPKNPSANNRGTVTSGIFDNGNIGDTVSDVFCVLIAKDGNDAILWSTVLRGYSLTLAAGSLAGAEIKATNAPVYTPDANGVAKMQTLTFTVTQNGGVDRLQEGVDYQIKDGSHQASAVGEHTLVLTGIGKYAGSQLTYVWTIKPRELIGILPLVKPYDGTADLLPNDIAFAYDGGEVTLKNNEDYTVTGRYGSAAAGSVYANVTVTLKNKNYTFADGATQNFWLNNASIIKANVPTDRKSGTITIYN